jgi:choice-of-anchor B domain-containing protein
MKFFLQFFAIALTLAKSSSECVGRCDSPEPLFFDGLSPSEYMMQEMEKDIYRAVFKNSLLPNRDITGAVVPCLNGFAKEYPCMNIDLLSHLTHKTLLSPKATGNDIWGWTDPLNGKEYAIVCQVDGTAFVDVTDPINPIVKGRLPTHTTSSSWRDAKVYKDHAFIVSEADNHGVQVFDLTRLRSPLVNQTFKETAYYGATGRCHNIVINEETGLAICVGSKNVCNAGLYMIDITSPASPVYAGCYAKDGYVHDAQCVIYRGPDVKYQGKEICFGYNEDTVTIIDVTNRKSPVLISRTGYPTYAYTHQGWLTSDQSFLMFDDELDEKRATTSNKGRTTTYILDVSSLEQPVLKGTHVSLFHSNPIDFSYNQY